MPELDQRQRTRLATHLAGLVHDGALTEAAELVEIARQRFGAPSALGRLPAPLRLDDDQVEMLAAQGATVPQIAALAGVSRATMFRRMSDSETISASFQRGAAALVMSAKRRLIFEGVVGGDVRALLALLGGSVEVGLVLEVPEIPEEEADEARRESVALELRRGLEEWRGVFGRRTIEGEVLENAG